MMQGSFKNLSDRGLKLDNIKKLSLFSNKMLEVFTNSQISIHTPAGHSNFINLIDNDNDHQIEKIRKFLYVKIF
jgi:competence protein ComGF